MILGYLSKIKELNERVKKRSVIRCPLFRSEGHLIDLED